MTEPALAEEQTFNQDEWKDKALRAMAELENFRVRMRKEMEQTRDRHEGEIILKFLDLADDMRRMIESFQTTKGPQARRHMIDGANLVFARFMNILDGLETKGFQAKGQQFAAELMEAIAETQTAALPPGTVVDELEQGFTRRGRLLRPARVVVASALPEKSDDHE